MSLLSTLAASLLVSESKPASTAQPYVLLADASAPPFQRASSPLR